MKNEFDRYTREVIEENAFNKTYFKATDITTKTIFRTFEEENDMNSVYDRKEKSRISDPEKFDNNRQNFNSWITKLADKFDENVITFKTEKSRIRYLMNNIIGKTKKSIEIRYQLKVRLFSYLAEMI
jgi:hypothetical protein